MPPGGRADDDRSVLTGESCDPDAPLARLGAAKPPAEYCLAAQGEGRLRGGLEGQMALELCRQRRDWQRRPGLGGRRHQGDARKLWLVGGGETRPPPPPPT